MGFMELVETKCATCGHEIHILEDYVREKMYCTVGCIFQESELIQRQS